MLDGRMAFKIGGKVVEDEIIALLHLAYQGGKRHIAIWLMMSVDLTVCCSVDHRFPVCIPDPKQHRIEVVGASQDMAE